MTESQAEARMREVSVNVLLSPVRATCDDVRKCVFASSLSLSLIRASVPFPTAEYDAINFHKIPFCPGYFAFSSTSSSLLVPALDDAMKGDGSLLPIADIFFAVL